MQLIAGQKIGNNLWVSVSLASRGKRSEMPGCFAGAQLWGLFSCICAFPGGRTLLSVCSKKENLALKWQLSHYSPRYGLYVFIDVLFTQSSIFGVYFRSKSAWWVIHSVSLYFLHTFLRCREMHCKVYKVGGIMIKMSPCIYWWVIYNKPWQPYCSINIGCRCISTVTIHCQLYIVVS